MRLPPFLCAALAAMGLLMPAIGRAGWQDDLSPPQPGGFPALRPLQAHYECGWSGFTAAYVNARFSHPAPSLAALDIAAATTGFVRTLWKLDATHEAKAYLATLQPIELHQTEIYSAKTVHSIVEFKPGSVTRLRSSTTDKNPARHKTWKFPNVFDIQTALLYVRSQPLRNGDTFNLVVFPGTTPYLATVTVLGREKIKVAAGSYPAIELDLKLQKITGDLALEPHPKFKHATGWLSDDQDRLPLRMNAQIFVGSVWAELARPPQPG